MLNNTLGEDKSVLSIKEEDKSVLNTKEEEEDVIILSDGEGRSSQKTSTVSTPVKKAKDARNSSKVKEERKDDPENLTPVKKKRGKKWLVI